MDAELPEVPPDLTDEHQLRVFLINLLRYLSERE
jgi:hypothetical protein